MDLERMLEKDKEHFFKDVKQDDFETTLHEIKKEIHAFISDMKKQKDITLFHVLSVKLKRLIDPVRETKNTSLLFEIGSFIFVLERISKNLIGNPNFTHGELHEFIDGSIPVIEELTKRLSWHQMFDVVLGRYLTYIQNFVTYWVRQPERGSRKRVDSALIDMTCYHDKENQEKRHDLLDKIEHEITMMITTLNLKRENVMLVIVKRNVGSIGLVLLLPEIVKKTSLDASILSMNLDGPCSMFGISGNHPKKRDLILVYDEDVTGIEIDLIIERLRLNALELKGIITLRDNPKEMGIMDVSNVLEDIVQEGHGSKKNIPFRCILRKNTQ